MKILLVLLISLNLFSSEIKIDEKQQKEYERVLNYFENVILDTEQYKRNLYKGLTEFDNLSEKEFKQKFNREEIRFLVSELIKKQTVIHNMAAQFIYLKNDYKKEIEKLNKK